MEYIKNSDGIEARAYSVTKDNALIEASYCLTLNEQRLVLSAIAQVDPRRVIRDKSEFTINARDFARDFGISERHAYEAMEEAATTLFERDINKVSTNGEKEKFRWVYHIKYHKGEGRVTLIFTPTISPYISQLHERFTSYQLRQVAGLKSPFSIRLFEMLMRFKSTGVYKVSVDKFKQMLDIEDQYPRTFDLKRRIIIPAVTELENKSNLAIKWTETKKGRITIGYEFKFSVVDQMDLLDDLGE
jgi:plasmid replication initiation protein